MEQIFKILKQLMGAAGPLGNVPKPIKMFMMYFGVLVGVLIVFKYTKVGQGEKTFLLVAFALLAVITGGYYAWKAWKQKQQSQQFGGDMSQHSSANPRSLSDPGQRARLDDMRKKFQSGVEAYKSRGKDLYKLPWYVIVGEPGSGKTEAIRHSNVGFPPGMQDEFQGVGGTINMNWWFTNHAVILDTAGRLMFEDVKPGETSEWREFLTLLKKNRPNCPINGLFLVIPSDSLIKDSADAIQKKAGKIAQQLDVIQRVLDVRFPVFVVVTKCDKINGFREFFDGLTDPQLQHQMMGWSNPDPLDEPFKPELVDKHLDQVAARLRRRRLGLLRDPVPENPDGRRTDEVDTLYALPHSLELLSSRLRRYLETIFIAGEWSAKPLFLRGIYFSSSMREGAALDAELAEAIGVGVEELPEGKVWERERAYFLRDLFLEKVFREKGLVTRASNTKRMLRTQQVALYSLGFVGLLVFAIVAWFARGDLRSGVKDQGDYWQVVRAAGWENRTWKQSLVPLRGDGSFSSTIATNTLLVDNNPVSLGEFHAKLRDLAEKPMKRSLVFPTLASSYNRNSKKAQRIVFEAGVVRPLIEGTRQKMARDDGTDPGAASHQADALAALIQLESKILSRGTGTNTGELWPDDARKFITDLQSYIAGKDLPADTNLVAVMSWVYSTNDTARGSWPPRWFSGQRGGAETLQFNSGISAGIDLFMRNATNGLQTHIANCNQISAVAKAADAFATAERGMFAAASANDETKFAASSRSLETARKSLDEELAKAAKLPMFADGPMLAKAGEKFRASVTSSAGAALNRIREINDAALAANPDYSLFKETKARLDLVNTALSSRVAQLLECVDLKAMQQLDESCMADGVFAHRADIYARVDKVLNQPPFPGGELLGLKADQLEKFKDELNGIRTEAAKSSAKVANDFNRTYEYELKRAERAYFTSYLTEARNKLAQAGFPLVSTTNRIATADGFMTATRHLKYISDDFASPVFKTAAAANRAEDWKIFTANIEAQQAIGRALVTDDGILSTCTISLAGATEATRTKDAWRDKWRNIKLVFPDGTGSEAIRTQDEGDQKIGAAPVQSKMELRVIENVGISGSATFSIPTGEWGPLWLLHRYKAERSKTDAKAWLLEFPIEAPGSTGMIRLKLEFDRPLPELEKWPAK